VLILKQELANYFSEWSLLFAGNSAILVQKLPHLHQFHLDQRVAARAFSCAHPVWSDALTPGQRLHQRGAKHLGGGEMQKLCITQARQPAARSRLAGVGNVALLQSVGDPGNALRDWWDCR